MENINDKENRKVAIIGIGATQVSYGIVASLLKQDATVVVPAETSRYLKKMDNYLKDFYTGRLVTVLTDLPDFDKAIALADMVIDEYGPIDIIVTPFNYLAVNADFSNIDILQWQRAVEENLAVYFVFCRVAIDVMKKRGQGMFVAIVDMDGLDKQQRNPMTEMLIAGQIKMARSFFEEVKNTGIKFYHLFINNLDKDPKQQEPGSKIITPEMIAQYILHIHNEDEQPGAPFLFLMGRPNTDLNQYFYNN